MKIYYESKSGEVKHSLFGTKKKNAKYVAKLPVGNGKFRYFYSNEELAAYQEGVRDTTNKNMKKRQEMLDAGSERRRTNKDLAKEKRIAEVKRDTQRRLESESKAREVEKQRKERKMLNERRAESEAKADVLKKKRIAGVERDIQRRLESESKAKAVEKKRNARAKTAEMLTERQSRDMGRNANGRALNYVGKNKNAGVTTDGSAKKKRIAEVERDIQRRLESESKAREVEKQRKRRKKLKRTTTHVQYLLNNQRKRAKQVRGV